MSDTKIHQTPEPGLRMLRYCGDTIEIRLTVSDGIGGEAFLRTNLGNVGVHRQEIIDSVESDVPRLDTDWHDHPMELVSDSEFVFRASLDEVGIFEAKAFFTPTVSSDLLWPEGGNISIKVEPAALAVANTIYTAFVRQFGANKSLSDSSDMDEDQAQQMEKKGYTVIPPSGKFRDLIDELDFIICEMGFRFIQLLPIHPVPTTYARMGRFGSPFAALDFFNVDRGLAEFDSATTPLDQFLELVREIHLRDGRMILDIALNHTGWASQLQIHHPEWFPRNADGSFRSPGAWGVVWKDLSELDYSHKSLWLYVAEVFLYWCSKGVDGFRCDAGYMIPFEVWEYVVAKVRSIYPDTVFLLEGLGGKVSVTKELLGRAGLNWAYSEIFQNYSRDELQRYLPKSFEIENSDGTLVCFAETHDNNRLAAEGQPYARMRAALCALISQSGAFAITNGVEWYAEEKVDVHGAPSLNWGAEENMVEWLTLLNGIISHHSAFQPGAQRRMIQKGDGNTLALLREGADGETAVVLVNLSAQSTETVHWKLPESFSSNALFDILNNESVDIDLTDDLASLRLEPAQVRCLTCREWTLPKDDSVSPFCQVVNDWRYRAKYLEVLHALGQQSAPIGPIDQEDVQSFIDNPARALREMAGGDAPLHVDLRLPRDLTRTVMVPPRHFLIISSPTPFMATEHDGSKAIYSDRSLPDRAGDHRLIIPPQEEISTLDRRMIEFQMFRSADEGPGTVQTEILRLPPYPHAEVRRSWNREELNDPELCALLVNERSTVSYVRAAWSEIKSQYDALLAVNPSDSYPDDRRILWTRCRSWVVCKDYSREIDLASLVEFTAGAGRSVAWTFALPVGSGKVVPIGIDLNLYRQRDAVDLTFTRCADLDGASYPLLDPEIPVQLIIRPDIEDRNFHSKTKAFLGMEGHFPASVEVVEGGFVFKPYDIALSVSANCVFVNEPEWHYMVNHSIERQRGLGDKSDLFSPGYFTINLKSGDKLSLKGEASRGTNAQQESDHGQSDGSANKVHEKGNLDLKTAAGKACLDFIVRRNSAHTVIAGYPWFLDWGRDTLIALRGIIAEGHHQLARDILIEFARFEQNGTLPNMIHGGDASNRDTSDAPLWFIVVCRELIETTDNSDLLEYDCGGRPLSEVIESIADNYCNGTPNGIVVDQDSGLVFSPEHYTWMDTQHPAGTPRVGYPIEIQALWSAALAFLQGLPSADRQRWAALKAQADKSILELFTLPTGGLSDCLHCESASISARDAIADDHCRPNQLFVVTLLDTLPHENAVRVLDVCADLLVPGAIRSLADAPVEQPLAVHSFEGSLLNDPSNPYWGQYGGDEDTRRKPAYHNGTAWGWPFPSYCEALVKVYGPQAAPTALALLGSAAALFNQGCAGHLPEILDGNAPHTQRGCTAQAWSATELARVIRLIP